MDGIRKGNKRGHYADGGRVRDVDGTMIDPNGPPVHIDRRSPERRKADDDSLSSARKRQAEYESKRAFEKAMDGRGIIGALKKTRGY